MKLNVIAAGLMRWAMLSFMLGLARGNNVPAAPDIATMVKVGQKTRERLLTEPARWVLRCILTPDEAIIATVVFDGQRRSYVFAHENSGRTTIIERIVELDETWFVEGGGTRQKTRPFEAALHFPGAYYFRSLADLSVLIDDTLLANASFQNQAGTMVTYRLPLSGQQRRMADQAVAAFDQMKQRNPKSIKPAIEVQAQTMKRLLANGILLRVDESTGIIVENRIQNMTVRVDEFTWLKQVPAGTFDLQDSGWDDRTPLWIDPNNWM